MLREWFPPTSKPPPPSCPGNGGQNVVVRLTRKLLNFCFSVCRSSFDATKENKSKRYNQRHIICFRYNIKQLFKPHMIIKGKASYCEK